MQVQGNIIYGRQPSWSGDNTVNGQLMPQFNTMNPFATPAFPQMNPYATGVSPLANPYTNPLANPLNPYVNPLSPYANPLLNPYGVNSFNPMLNPYQGLTPAQQILCRSSIRWRRTALPRLWVWGSLALQWDDNTAARVGVYPRFACWRACHWVRMQYSRVPVRTKNARSTAATPYTVGPRSGYVASLFEATFAWASSSGRVLAATFSKVAPALMAVTVPPLPKNQMCSAEAIAEAQQLSGSRSL
jgi:hypothetical protein